MNAKKTIRNLVFFNDNMNLIWVIVMLFFAFNTSLMFSSASSYYGSSILLYSVTVMLTAFAGKINFKRVDFSDNIARNIIIFLMSLGIFTFLVQPENVIYAIPFTNRIFGMIYYLFVVAYSETLISYNLQQRLKRTWQTALIMGLLHFSAYSSIMGVDFSTALLFALLKCSLGFFIFRKINEKSDNFGEAIAHFVYDAVVVSL